MIRLHDRLLLGSDTGGTHCATGVGETAVEKVNTLVVSPLRRRGKGAWDWLVYETTPEGAARPLGNVGTCQQIYRRGACCRPGRWPLLSPRPMGEQPTGR